MITHSTNDVIIRGIRLSEDREALLRLLDEDERPSLSKLPIVLSEKDAFCLVAQAGNEIIGWTVVHLSYCQNYGWEPDPDTPGFQSNGNGYLEYLKVKGEQRGRGVGALLLNEAAMSARSCGKRFLWLHVRKSNERAIHFYERHGWRYHYTTNPEWCKNRPMKVYQKEL